MINIWCIIDEIILLMLKLVSNKLDTYLTSWALFVFCISWNFARDIWTVFEEIKHQSCTGKIFYQIIKINKTQILLNIQYWSVDGKYRIYLTRLRNGVKDELLASLSPRFAPSQINSKFTVNRPILYLSCNPRCPKK